MFHQSVMHLNMKDLSRLLAVTMDLEMGGGPLQCRCTAVAKAYQDGGIHASHVSIDTTKIHQSSLLP
jgi:hypothetical protein